MIKEKTVPSEEIHRTKLYPQKKFWVAAGSSLFLAGAFAFGAPQVGHADATTATQPVAQAIPPVTQAVKSTSPSTEVKADTPTKPTASNTPLISENQPYPYYRYDSGYGFTFSPITYDTTSKVPFVSQLTKVSLNFSGPTFRPIEHSTIRFDSPQDPGIWVPISKQNIPGGIGKDVQWVASLGKAINIRDLGTNAVIGFEFQPASQAKSERFFFIVNEVSAVKVIGQDLKIYADDPTPTGADFKAFAIDADGHPDYPDIVTPDFGGADLTRPGTYPVTLKSEKLSTTVQLTVLSRLQATPKLPVVTPTTPPKVPSTAPTVEVPEMMMPDQQAPTVPMPPQRKRTDDVMFRKTAVKKTASTGVHQPVSLTRAIGFTKTGTVVKADATTKTNQQLVRTTKLPQTNDHPNILVTLLSTLLLSSLGLFGLRKKHQ